jgi:hypothetical protein
MTVTIIAGPDDHTRNAVSLSIVDSDGDLWGNDSWTSPKARHPTTTRGWLTRIRRHIHLPQPVKDARPRLSWEDATVKPYGWSEGAGHAPNGVTITWTVGE